MKHPGQARWASSSLLGMRIEPSDWNSGWGTYVSTGKGPPGVTTTSCVSVSGCGPSSGGIITIDEDPADGPAGGPRAGGSGGGNGCGGAPIIPPVGNTGWFIIVIGPICGMATGGPNRVSATWGLGPGGGGGTARYATTPATARGGGGGTLNCGMVATTLGPGRGAAPVTEL